MEVFRFMSNDEFEKYKSGKTLYNNTKHKAKTDSVGFCFFNIEDVTPETAWEFLKGVIYPEVCVVFEVDENCLKKGYGMYRDTNMSLYELMNFMTKFVKMTEYSTTQYDQSRFKLKKYTTNKFDIFKREKDFKWRNCK